MKITLTNAAKSKRFTGSFTLPFFYVLLLTSYNLMQFWNGLDIAKCMTVTTSGEHSFPPSYVSQL